MYVRVCRFNDHNNVTLASYETSDRSVKSSNASNNLGKISFVFTKNRFKFLPIEFLIKRAYINNVKLKI